MNFGELCMSRVRPVHRPASFWIILALLVFGLVVFSPALTQLSLTELFESCIPKVQPISKPEVKVWVSQRSDVYYCPGSKGYGTRAPGEYMTESEAIHKGFRGRAKVLCGEASPTTMRAVVTRPRR